MKKPTFYLCLSVSHNSSAALMKDGEIIVAVCEERSKRVKNFFGYPKNAVEYCLSYAGISAADLSGAAYTTTENAGLLVKCRNCTAFSLKDYREYYGEKYYRRRINGENCLDYLQWLRDDKKFQHEDEMFDFSYLTDAVLLDPALEAELFRKAQASTLSKHIGYPEEQIKFLDHHTCHAYYAYFGSPFRQSDCLVFILDGWGDGRNQTVWKASNDRISLLAESTQNDIGRVYKMATLLLGMRPDEHEFKVMGLAPYAKHSYAKKAKQCLDGLTDVKEMRLVEGNRPRDLFQHLTHHWELERFDNIAGAVQMYTEEKICELVLSAVHATGIRKLVLGGGIAMNIKANKAVADLEAVEDVFVCGSSGDESLSIGGCYLLNEATGSNKYLSSLYLGNDVTDEHRGLDLDSISRTFKTNREATASEIGELLARGDIVAVIRGRAEFGARALGNRSILADPRRRDTIQKINEAIKNRDFWMPFALSILEERHRDFLLNPKDLSSPFMAVAMDSRPEKHKLVEAGTHPYDKTVRPQFVSQAVAPQYHALIEAFYRITNVPALLNTSFNLHGEPIVDSINDALRTFRLSGIDHLYINDTLLLSKT